MGSRFRAQVAKAKRSNLGTAPHAVTVYYEEGVLLSLNPETLNPEKVGGGSIQEVITIKDIEGTKGSGPWVLQKTRSDTIGAL